MRSIRRAGFTDLRLLEEPISTAVAYLNRANLRYAAVYELGGPEILTMKEVMERVLAYTMRKRWLVPLPFFLAKLQGAGFDRVVLVAVNPAAVGACQKAMDAAGANQAVPAEMKTWLDF